MKRRVMFVDDEADVLDGLRLALRRRRKEWDMTFVTSGAEAVGLLAKEPYDVVVSDMRMPGMDGVQFLRTVRDLNPEAVRIGLSGHTDSEQIIGAVGITHQYLSKPCNAETLHDAVDKAVNLRTRLQDPGLRRTLGEMETIPAVPALFEKVMRELESPDPSLRAVADVIAVDVGMSARMLQIVNSAYFGLQRRVGCPSEAVIMLGMRIVTALVLQTKIFESFGRLADSGLDPAALSRRSASVAGVAREIARFEGCGRSVSDDAFIGGLLHGLGKLLLADKFPGRYAVLDDIRRAGGVSDMAAERSVFGTTHMDVGAHLLALWGFTYSVIEAVACYRRPAEACQSGCNAATAVHVADAFQRAREAGDESDIEAFVDTEYLNQLGLMPRLDHWRKLLANTLTLEEVA